MKFSNLMLFFPRPELQNGVYYIYIIQEGSFKFIGHTISGLDSENLIPVFDSPDEHYFLYAKKQDFTYEYFLKNPLDLKPIDLEHTQSITKIFTEQQFNHLKFLKKLY